MVKSFSEKVFKSCKKIPRGRVTSYKEIAVSLHKSNASRAVGNAVGKNPIPLKVPCHRVVRSNGSLGGYIHGTAKKRKLLRAEGIKIKNNKVVSLNEYLVRAKELR